MEAVDLLPVPFASLLDSCSSYPVLAGALTAADVVYGLVICHPLTISEFRLLVFTIFDRKTIVLCLPYLNVSFSSLCPLLPFRMPI